MLVDIKKYIFLLLLLCVFHRAAAFHSISDEERASMPVMHHVDRFSKCVDQRDGVFCTTHASLYSYEPHQLLQMMDTYKNAALRHFNYSKIVYGLCMTDRCKSFYIGNSSKQLQQAAEDCLTDHFTKEYGLRARVQKLYCYHHKEEKYSVDRGDWIMLYVILGIIALNLIATVYDLYFDLKGEEGFLLSFSLRANWDRLSRPATSDPRKSKLSGLNGMRAMTTGLVMLGHAPIWYFSSIENPQWLEFAFENTLLQILFQGHVITLTFFTMSGFLLTYNVQTYAETNKLHWSLLFKGIFIRWLRLVPINIFILAVTATWFKFTPYGPYWMEHVGLEVEDCRRYWLPNVLYYNNYMDNSNCNIQNWSMATDMHLHIIGLAVILLSPTVKTRNRALLVVFLIGLILPAIETYAKDLDATFLVVPEMVREFFLSDPTFNNTYRRSHTNIPCFILGMAVGYFVYEWQTKTIPERTKKWLTGLYWTLFLLVLLIPICTFFVFLDDGPRPPLYLRVIYSIVQKPVFGLVISGLIAGLALQVEVIPAYRWILEWPAWTPLSKLTYSMFSVHVLTVRFIAGTKTTLTYMSVIHVMRDFAGLVIMSISFGFVLYMLLEGPLGQILKVLFAPKTANKVTQQNTNGVKHTIQNGYSNTTQKDQKSLKTE